MKNIKLIGYGVAVVAAASGMAAVNLVVNPGFELGDTGFTSLYTSTPYASQSMGLPDTYTVGASSQFVHSQWLPGAVNVAAHSGQNYMLNNGSESDSTVWRSGPIAGVVSGSQYFFEAWVVSLFPSNPPQLKFQISADAAFTTPIDLGLSLTPTPPGTWTATSTIWNATFNSPVWLRLQNAQFAFSGNDFGVDDINFSLESRIPEAQTLAAAAGLFGVAGLTILRRRNKKA